LSSRFTTSTSSGHDAERNESRLDTPPPLSQRLVALEVMEEVVRAEKAA
jgi:hypothetical protein